MARGQLRLWERPPSVDRDGQGVEPGFMHAPGESTPWRWMSSSHGVFCDAEARNRRNPLGHMGGPDRPPEGEADEPREKCGNE